MNFNLGEVLLEKQECRMWLSKYLLHALYTSLTNMLNFFWLFSEWKIFLHRHKEDERANKRVVTVVRRKRLTEIKSEQVEVGDILYLVEDQEVPCDAIVLNTSHSQVV